MLKRIIPALLSLTFTPQAFAASLESETTKVEEVADVDLDAEQSLTGLLMRVAGIGGESTGFALLLANNETVEIDLATNHLDRDTLALEGESVVVSGFYKSVSGIESGERSVFEVATFEE